MNDNANGPPGPQAPAPMDPALLAKVKTKIDRAGEALAWRSNAVGIAMHWASKLKSTLKFSEANPTWWIDGSGVYANPRHTADLPVGELLATIAHEDLHEALDHFGLAKSLGLVVAAEGGRWKGSPDKAEDFDLLGQAADMLINTLIEKDKIGTVGKDWLRLPGEYNGPLDTLSIFHWLKTQRQEQQEQEQQGGESGDGDEDQQSGGGGQPGDEGDGGGEGQPQAGQGCMPMGDPLKANDGDKAQARELIAKFAGKGSAIAEALLPRPGRTSWRAVLRGGFSKAAGAGENRSKRSFGKLARRDLEDGILLPGKVPTDATLAVCIDVSGSVSRELVAKAAGETMKLAREYPRVKVLFVTHTERPVFCDWLKPGGDIDKVSKGTGYSGGTAFEPAYRAIAALAPRAGQFDAMVHFTDGYGDSTWPEPPAKTFVIGLCGAEAMPDHATPAPDSARVIPVLED